MARDRASGPYLVRAARASYFLDLLSCLENTTTKNVIA